MPQIALAHSPNSAGTPHLLADHLEAVASLAERFASTFGAGELARVTGMLHDIGKANPDFQDYLLKSWKAEKEGGTKPKSTPHSVYGGIALAQTGLPVLSVVAAGHHGGLSNLCDLKPKLSAEVDGPWFQEAVSSLDRNAMGRTALPEYAKDALPCEFLIRMLFSALVDADWLDTEAHFNSTKIALRGNAVHVSDLWKLFESDQNGLLLKAASSGESPINRPRREIYEACLEAADGPQGVYRLTVPTGGGKTRSGMGFALRHAIKHGLDRIIFAIPYTSIIDQTADVYQGIFGAENALEHHSAIEPTLDPSEGESEAELRRQLATENWDAPIVVTTTVQLFESLFSNKPSRCRKLHNLARSVLVLDEVQTLPIQLLKPILDVLRELVDHYGVTLVLSTATQPAFSGESPYLKGFSPEPMEIVAEPGRYFETLKRVEYQIEDESWTWGRVADEMMSESQALCVVNSRKDAVALFRLLDDPTALHLSTLMCPAHRRDTLKEIRTRLEDGKPCRVISTQVVEAGVDLDFPVVLRAMGPLDRIVQAAGRCNREGRLEQGRVIVFRPEEGRGPRGSYATATSEAGIMLSAEECNLHSPEVFDLYFRRLWQDCCLDSHGIMGLRERLNYQTVAERFRMISEDTVPVVVPYGDPGPEAMLRTVKFKGSANRDEWRKLQNLSVSIFRHSATQYEQDGLIKPVLDGLYEWTGIYNEHTGISAECPDPADLVVTGNCTG